MKLFLNNREYNGNIYFLTLHTPGKLMAACWGADWGVGTGTCLAPLKDENGNSIILPDYAGKEDYYRDGKFENLSELNK